MANQTVQLAAPTTVVAGMSRPATGTLRAPPRPHRIDGHPPAGRPRRRTGSDGASAFAGGVRHRPPSVLVVDDDRDLVELMQKALRHFGMVTSSGVTGDDALRGVRSARIDEVVLDVMIPHPDGIEVARQLRRNHWSGPLVMISARTSPTDRERVFAAGADAFLPKPFSLRTLCDLLQRLHDGPPSSGAWPAPLRSFLPDAPR